MVKHTQTIRRQKKDHLKNRHKKKDFELIILFYKSNQLIRNQFWWG